MPKIAITLHNAVFQTTHQQTFSNSQNYMPQKMGREEMDLATEAITSSSCISTSLYCILCIVYQYNHLFVALFSN